MTRIVCLVLAITLVMACGSQVTTISQPSTSALPPQAAPSSEPQITSTPLASVVAVQPPPLASPSRIAPTPTQQPESTPSVAVLRTQPPIQPANLSTELEECLREVLTPDVFTAVFITGSRAESAEETPLITQCFVSLDSRGDNNKQGTPPADHPNTDQGPTLNPQVEACLREVLSPDAFTAVFITGSRGESAAEAPLIGQCFEAQDSGGAGGQQGTPPSGQRPGGQPPSQRSGGQQGTPPGGHAPTSQGPALTPQLEACLRGALSPDAFTAVFITGSRGESAAEAPLIGQCFETQGSGGSGGQQGTPPSGQGPGGQPPSQGSGGQQASQSSWQTRETHLCYRAGLGTQAFTDVVLASKRDATPAESNTMATCRSLGGPGSDMPVFDLAQVYRSDLFPRIYPETVIGTSAHAWFEFMDVMADDIEVNRLQATGTNAFHSVILYGIDSNGDAFLHRPKEAANLIIRARIRGLAVHLSLDTFTYDVPCNGSHEENLASYIRVQTQAAIAFARFADALNVEYLSPGNEHEGGFQGPCLDSRLSQDSGRHPDEQMLDPQGEPGLTARVAVSRQWHLDVLPDVRAVFGGHLVAGYGTIHPAAVTPGYDGLMFTLDHAHLSEDKFSARVQANYQAAAEAAGGSGGIPWYVNAYLPYSHIAEATNPEMPEYDPNYVIDEDEDARMKVMQEIYVAVSISAFRDFNSQSGAGLSAPGGYLLAGWIDKGKEIRDSNLEKIVVENFG